MAISLVQQAQATAFSANILISITAAGVGDYVLVFFSGAATVVSVSCTNITFSKLGSIISGSNSDELWGGVVAGGSSGTTITVNYGGAGAGAASAAEFSGLATSSVADGTAAIASGSSFAYPITITVGSYSNTNANDLIVAVGATDNSSGTFTTPTGYTALVAASRSGAEVQGFYKVVAAAGLQNPSWTLTGGAGTANWGTVIIGLKALVVAVVETMPWNVPQTLIEDEAGRIVGRI